MYKNLSLRTNHSLIGLFNKAQMERPLSSRVEIFNEAVSYALEDSIEFEKLSKVNFNYPVDKENSIPEFIQLKVDEEKWCQIVNKAKESFTPPLKKTTAPYVVKLVLLNYVQNLEMLKHNSNKNADTSEDMHQVCIESKDLPEMAKILFQMMLIDENCAELREIKNLMIEWRARL